MNELYRGLSFGPPPKSATLRDLKTFHDVFVNLRTETDTSHWYFPTPPPLPTDKKPLKQSKESTPWTTLTEDVEEEEVHIKTIQFIRFPIEHGKLANGKHINELCRQIVKYIVKDGLSVYIHCSDGSQTCGPLVLGCFYWLKEEKGFDPIEYIHKGTKLRFLLCKSKEQRKQLGEIKEYAQKMTQWGTWGVQKRLKLDK